MQSYPDPDISQLQFFEREGCRMVEMTCDEHDRHAASSQFITHTVGRFLGAMDLQAGPIDTRGYQSLLKLVDQTTHDSFDLYYGLFMYNAVRNSLMQLVIRQACKQQTTLGLLVTMAEHPALMLYMRNGNMFTLHAMQQLST